MDDLKLLRDFGRTLEHEPPATLMRQRQRLMTSRPRRRRSSFLMMGLVAAATALAVAVPTVLLSNRSPAPVAGSRPVNVSGVQNILLVGSDTRQGEGNAKYGAHESRTGGTARSDTIVLVHLPADRGKPIVVNIPRDSLVDIPKCGSAPARRDMINSAYSSGGVDCLVLTLEKLTKVRVDHHVEVDFSGFKKVVDALGGVEITIKTPINDPKSKLTLPSGTSVLNGEQALGYFRLRNYGDGSDIQRIKRQQQLLRSMLKKAKTAIAKDPGNLRGFLSAVTGATKTDLDIDALSQLAAGLEKSKPTFLTVPWQPAPDDPNRIAWKQPEADAFFKNLR